MQLGSKAVLMMPTAAAVAVTTHNVVAARTQPIIANSTPDMIKDHFLPIARKLKENAEATEQLEKRLAYEKRISSDGSEDLEQYVQDVSELCVCMWWEKCWMKCCSVYVISRSIVL